MKDLLTFADILWDGLAVTVLVTIGAALVSIPASFVSGLFSHSRRWPLRWLAASYVAVFRGTSAVVQLFWAYFVLPLLGVNLNAMTAGIVVLGLNTGAYGSEVVRGALSSVPETQRQAGVALNFTERQIAWRIVIPQALLVMLPSFGNLLIELLKNSALVSLITLADLTFQGQSVLRWQFPASTLSIFALLLVIYFILAQALGGCVRLLEKHLSKGRSLEGTA